MQSVPEISLAGVAHYDTIGDEFEVDAVSVASNDIVGNRDIGAVPEMNPIARRREVLR